MSRFILKFKKTEPLIFIGHLDLLRLMHKCARRAGLDAVFSSGFNPHLLMTVALPLSVGVTGENEYAVIELNNAPPSCESLVNSLTNAAPRGLTFTAARQMSDTEKSPAALVAYAKYDITLAQCSNLSSIITHALAKPNMFFTNPKTKADVDIKPDIIELEKTSGNTFSCIISAGSAKNLKPSFLAEYLTKEAGLVFEPYKVLYTRREIYKKSKDGTLVSLFL